MKTSRILLLFAVLVLSLGLVTATLAAAGGMQVTKELGISEDPTRKVLNHQISPRGLQRQAPVQVQEDSSEIVPGRLLNGPAQVMDNLSLSQGDLSQVLGTPQQAGDAVLTLDLEMERIWGFADPGDQVTVTRQEDGAYGSAEADGVGFFWTRLFDSDGGQPVDLQGGDSLEVFFNSEPIDLIELKEIDGSIDVLADQVTGIISDGWAGIAVTVTVSSWGENSLPGQPQASTTSDGNGAFTVTFNHVDLGAETIVAVDYRLVELRGPSEDTQLVHSIMRTHLYPNDPVFLVQQYRQVAGYAPRGETVTVTVNSPGGKAMEWQGTTHATFPFGFYAIEAEEIDPDDTVDVEFSDGTNISTTVANLGNLSFDTDLDQVSGTAPDGTFVRVSMSQWQNGDYVYTKTIAETGEGTTFQASFEADLRPRDQVDVVVKDENGNQTQLLSGAPFLDVFIDPTSEWDCVVGRVDGPELLITYTLDTGTMVYTREHPISLSDVGNTLGDILGRGGYCFLMWGPDWGPIDFSPGNTVTVKTPTWEGSLVLGEVSWGADTANEQISGEAPPGEVEVFVQQWHGDQYPNNGSATQMTTAASPYAATFTDFDVRNSGKVEVRHFDPISDYATHVFSWEDNMPFFEVRFPNAVGGFALDPGDIITVTLSTSDGIPIASTSYDHDDGFSFWFEFDGLTIEPGNWVTLTSMSGWETGLQVPTLTIDVDENTDMIWGDGPKTMLYLEGGRDDSGFSFFVPVDGYALDTAALDHDLLSGDDITVFYQAPSGDRVRRDYYWQEIYMTVNYAQDWVMINTIPLASVVITVTDSGGAPKATVAGNADWDGYFMSWEFSWNPGQLDIVPGDVVTATAISLTAAVNPVGTISGELDIENDTISGHINALFDPWYITLTVHCQVWVHDGPRVVITDVVAGGGSYLCDFGGLWDIQPGEDIGVSYLEPDDDSVINIFREPAPSLRIDKRSMGDASEGGNLQFHISYNNDGDGDAENVVITDTMYGGMLYITDTLGIQPTGSGSGPIVWNLGTVSAGESVDFDMFVWVTGETSQTIDNHIQIATSNQYDQGDPGEKSVWWSGQVQENDTHLNVGKWAWTDYPAADTDFIWTVNVCNDSNTGSSQVVLTDTLPISTTLVDWWAQAPGWEEEYRDGTTLVVSRPSIPAWWCGEVYLRTHLDANAWNGMGISNTATITASNDIENWDNETNHWVWVSDPHSNLDIAKWWNWGQLVPGGEIQYHIGYGNSGNVPVDNVVITETLPVSTSLVYVWAYDQNWNDLGQVTPTLETDELVVWDVGTVENGFGGNFEIRLQIDQNALPGTVLTNAVEISRIPDEDSYDDNYDRWVEDLFASGANLRVTKDHDWNGDWGLHYNVNFMNIGDEVVYGVKITDTLPLSTTFNWNWGYDFWEEITLTHNYTDGLLIWELTLLDPGWNSGLSFDLDLDDPGVYPRWFTNTIEISTPPDDPSPDDNTATDVAFTGGEVTFINIDVNQNYLDGGSNVGPITITSKNEWSTHFCCYYQWWTSEPFLPGDVITITAGPGNLPVIAGIPDPYEAVASSITDTVWGQVNHLDSVWVEVSLDNGPSQWVQTDGAGNFQAVFADISRIDEGTVRYCEMINYADVCYNLRFQTLDLRMDVNYGHDWVEGQYEAGYTVWITVTENDGFTVKATAVLTSQLVPEWGGWTGFSTGVGDPWAPGQPDIMAGDWVFARSSNGYTNSVHIGDISGFMDTASDLITGTVNAGWLLTERVDIECHTWGAPEWAPNPENKWYYGLLPDGGDPYTCEWHPINEWDLRPGQTIAVQYYEPDGDTVFNVFREPSADMWVEKWVDGNPQVMVGGPVPFNIRFGNQGDITAEGIVLTDTLPDFTAYLTDTSGLQPTFGSDWVAWTLGSMEPGEEWQFQIVLTHSAELSTTLTNRVDIYTVDEGNEDDNHAEADAHVSDELPDLYVNKDVSPGDPAPGETFLYEIYYGNSGPVASGPVVLTDTLPTSTTVVSWYSRESYPLWSEVITSGGQFVLTAPTIPGYWSDRLYLRLRVEPDVPIGTQLTNTVAISTAWDANLGDNWDKRDDAWVENPHASTWLYKQFNWATLVPGGEVEYSVDFQNDGNIGIPVVITDTFPEETAFLENRGRILDYQGPIPPDYLDNDIAVWQIDWLEPGEQINFNIRLAISDTVTPNTVITNCAAISQPEEEWLGDNFSCYADTVRESGANLRVRKWHNWEEDWRLNYQLQVHNLGDETVYGVRITDTYPLSTTFNWEWDHNMDQHITLTHNYTDNQLIWELERMEPSWGFDLKFNVDLDQPGERLRWYTNTVEIGPVPGDIFPGDNIAVDVAFSGWEVDWVDLYARTTYISGEAPQGPITVTTQFNQVIFPSGGFFDWSFDEPFEPGDIVTVEAGAGSVPVVIQVPDPFTAFASSITDTVWGQIDHLDHEWVQVALDGYDHEWVQTDANGYYRFTLHDIPRGGRGVVRYIPTIGYAQVFIILEFRAPDLVITADYGHDWVNGNYEAGHTVWITVTESDGVTIKGTQMMTTGIIPWWEGQSGFETRGEDWIPDAHIDIQPGDWVFGRVDNGYTASVHIGTIDGWVNYGADIVSGTLHADWFSPTLLTISCEIHEEGGHNIQIYDVNPDGGEYTCNFSGMWDIEPNHNVAVNYTEPDGDMVQTHFQETMPYLRIEKWTHGDPGEGGNLLFHIQYYNDGDGDAENVIITDTLYGGMTYISDTLGLPHSGSGSGPIVWNLGTLPPGEWVFHMEVEVTSPSSTTLGNNVQISTSSPYDQGDPGEKDIWWDGHVMDNDTHLNVGKHPWTDDHPAPGIDFVWVVNVCNDGDTGSSQVTLTDTLPLSTTLVDWWSQYPWAEEYHDDTSLVLSKPVIPGWWCEEVYIRTHLDEGAWYGMPLTNTAVVAASNDMESDDNQTQYTVWVGDPHTNLIVNKWLGWGQLVPGGIAIYNVYYENNGNMPVENVLITDTLPVSTSLDSIERYDRDWNYIGPVTPLLETEEYVVWEVGTVENGFSGYFEVMLQIDGQVEPGSVLTNSVEISRLPGEDHYEDNFSDFVVRIYEHGPNLGVTKVHEWNEDWGLFYRINFENIGDEPVYGVVITDTYPLLTTFNGDWGTNFWEPITLTHNYTDSQLIWEVGWMDPGWNVEVRFNVDLDEPGVPSRTFTNTVEITVPPQDPSPEDNSYVDVAFSGGEVTSVDINVYEDYLSGEAPRGPITVTTAYTQIVFPDGGFFDWNFHHTFEPSQTITVAAGAGLNPVIIHIPDPFDARASSITDTVWGQIDHLDHAWINVELEDGPSQDGQTDGDGNFSATFYDVPRGGRGEVSYCTGIDYAAVCFHRSFQTQDLVITTDYGYDWVNGNYEAGHTVWITVTESDGVTIKGTQVMTTGIIPWWEGESGFETSGEDWIPDPNIDIQPGDWVFGRVDNGYTNTVHIGTIDGGVNYGSDIVSGTLHAAWFSPTLLTMNCEIHEENAPAIQIFDVDPDGGEYLCNFSGMWDIEPNHNVAVNYTEPDNDMVQTHFQEPAAHLRIDKWAPGWPTEGSNSVFKVWFINDGDAPAENVVLTDTLTWMYYVTDTSGLPHSGSGNGPIVWDVGTLQPGEEMEFDVFVFVSAEASMIATNTVEIATSSPTWDGEQKKSATWSGEVAEYDTQSGVEKLAWTGDPAPGYDYVYAVSACNYGSTDSHIAILSDTLSLSTTLLNWWSDVDGWYNVFMQPHRLTLSRPTIEAESCANVYINVHLDEDAWVGMPITNTAEIYTVGDPDLSDNRVTLRLEANDPYVNLFVNKDWYSGQLVPGGYLVYEMQFGNNGNTPAENVVFTDTLPANTSLWGIWESDRDLNFIGLVTPTLETADTVVWRVAMVENGYQGNFAIVLRVDEGAIAGTVLTNTVEVARDPGEWNTFDNSITWVERLNQDGPNLQVHKQNYHWAGVEAIEYEIRIKNLGSERLEHFWIYDTYPLSTTFNENSNWELNHGPLITITHDEQNRLVGLWVEGLDPGHTASVSFRVDLEDTITGTQGLLFTNTLEAPIPGDVNPDDNSDIVVAYAGLNAYIEKWLSGGIPRAGEVITYTVLFGNRGRWPGIDDQAGSHITDTLPAGMTFITATHPGRPDLWWPPEEIYGDSVVWGWYTLRPQSYSFFDISAQINYTLTGGEVLTNVIELQSNEAGAIDWHPQDNIFELPITVLPPEAEVVLSLKPPTSTAYIGENIDVVIQVSAEHLQVDATAAHLNFDPDYLQVVNISTNPVLPLVIQNQYDNLTGEIDYVAGTFSNFPSGTFSVATVTLQTISPTMGTLITYNLALPRMSDVTSAGYSVLDTTEDAQVTILSYADILGSVTLQGRPVPPDPSWSVPLTLSLTLPGDSLPAYVFTPTMDESGYFTVTDITPGAYTARVKNSHTLQNTRGISLTSGSQQIDFGTLREGDANDDNYVTLIDFSILATTYAKCEGMGGFDERADFNEDDCVTLPDFSLLAINYGQGGDSQAVLAGGAPDKVESVNGVSITVEPPTSTVGLGETFTLTIEIQSGAQLVDGAQASLDFDPEILQVIAITGNTSAFPLVLLEEFDNISGTIDYAAGTFSNFPSGSIDLIEVELQAVQITTNTAFAFHFGLPRETDVTFGGHSVLSNHLDGEIDVLPYADLEISKMGTPDSLIAGGMLTYTLTITNHGPDPAKNVVVSDTLPAGVDFLSATPGVPTCTEFVGTVTCEWDPLAVSATEMVTIVVEVDTQAQGILTNKASISGNVIDSVEGNDGDTAETTVYVPVQADFTATPTMGFASLDVDFTNLSTGDFDTCDWDFGDSGSSDECNDPSHTYVYSGTYPVTLTVSGLGGMDVISKTDYISVTEREEYIVHLPLIAHNFGSTIQKPAIPGSAFLAGTRFLRGWAGQIVVVLFIGGMSAARMFRRREQ